ncbi:hypothetical protein DER44DRAFT_678391, partial [Fusarium oxysporum]
LQHTGWPRLFHGRPLGIIAATAKKPKPAWNEDYLLGQWNDTALRSPAAVEAQLRIILRGVDLMIDRAVFTLAKTSYRSRCWLNTYWKDNFWPHEFKVVNCLKQDMWMYGRGSFVMCPEFNILKHISSKTDTTYDLDAMKPS